VVNVNRQGSVHRYNKVTQILRAFERLVEVGAVL